MDENTGIMLGTFLFILSWGCATWLCCCKCRRRNEDEQQLINV
jgi:hypothetical protein